MTITPAFECLACVSNPTATLESFARTGLFCCAWLKLRRVRSAGVIHTFCEEQHGKSACTPLQCFAHELQPFRVLAQLEQAYNAAQPEHSQPAWNLFRFLRSLITVWRTQITIMRVVYARARQAQKSLVYSGNNEGVGSRERWKKRDGNVRTMFTTSST